MAEVYNPLDKKNLGKSVADALLEREAIALSDIPPSKGAGIYALYYRGEHPLYQPISEVNRAQFAWPIYVGKAIPSGGRKGANLDGDARGTALFSRLSKHRSSIGAVEAASGDLKVSDFFARFLVVDDIWIPLGESLLIARFRPIWNVLLEGFGNNDPGAGRYNGLRPLWDHIHQGRSWAIKCVARQETSADIQARVLAFFDAHPISNAKPNF